MPQRMIDRAEMIQIKNRNGNGTPVAFGVSNRFYETVLEPLPIRQARERVMGGEILQARMDFLEFAGIPFALFPECVAGSGHYLDDRQHGSAERSDGDHEKALGR